MKKFRLLKSLPGVQSGTMFAEVNPDDLPEHVKRDMDADDIWYSPKAQWAPIFHADEVETNIEWFKESVNINHKAIESQDIVNPPDLV